MAILPRTGGQLLTASVALTSAAIVIAVTRHRLYDIDELLSATVVYGLVGLGVVLVDVVVVALAGRVLPVIGR